MNFENKIFPVTKNLEKNSSEIISSKKKTKNDIAKLREELVMDYKNFNNPDFYFSGGKSEMEKSILEKENNLRSLETKLSAEIEASTKMIKDNILKLREELALDYKNFNNPDFYFSGGKSEMEKSILEKENSLRSLEIEQKLDLDEELPVEENAEPIAEPIAEPSIVAQEELVAEPMVDPAKESIIKAKKPTTRKRKPTTKEEKSEPIVETKEESELIVETKEELNIEPIVEVKKDLSSENNLEPIVELDKKESRKEKVISIYNYIRKKLGLKYAAAAAGIFAVSCSTSPSEKEQQAFISTMEKTFQDISANSVETNKQEAPAIDIKIDASGKVSGEIRKTPVDKKEVPTKEIESIKVDSVEVDSVKVNSVEIDSVETKSPEINKVDSTVVLEDQPVDFSKLESINLDEIIKKEMESKVDSTKQDSSVVNQGDTLGQETVKVKKNFFQRLFNFKSKKENKIDNILPTDSITIENVPVDSVSINMPTDSIPTGEVPNSPKMSNGGNTMETGDNIGGRSGMQSMPFSGLDDGNNEASNRALYTENNILSKNNIKSDKETINTLDAFSKGKTISTETPKKSNKNINVKNNNDKIIEHAGSGDSYSKEDIIKEKIKGKLKFKPIKQKTTADSTIVKNIDSTIVKNVDSTVVKDSSEVKTESVKSTEIKSESVAINTPKVENIAPKPEANLFVIDKGEGYSRVAVDASLAEYFPKENSNITIEKQGEDYYVKDKGDGYNKVIIDSSLKEYFPKENSNVTIEKQGEDYFVIDKGDGYSKVIIDSSAQDYLSNNKKEVTPEVGTDVRYESKGPGYSEVILDASLYKYLPKKDSVIVLEKINDDYYIKSKNKDATPVILDASVMKYFPQGNEVKIERQGDEIRIEGKSIVILDPSLGITKEDYEKYLRGKSAKKLTQ